MTAESDNAEPHSIETGAHGPPGRTAGLARSPWTVAAVVLLAYGTWLGLVFSHGRDSRDFIQIGAERIRGRHGSSIIKLDPTYRPEYTHPGGFDGQYYYFMALDPLNAHYYMDNPVYRSTRILYPLIARTLALGDPKRVPASLILTNLIAIVGGTLAVAAYLKRRKVSPWWALIYGFYPGLFISLTRDLSEAVAFGLVAAAILVFYSQVRLRILYAGLLFALACLSREQAAIFPIVYGVSLIFGWPEGGVKSEGRGPRRWNEALLLMAVALLPLTCYRIGLTVWLGSGGYPRTNLPSLMPFGGLWNPLPWTGSKPHMLAVVPPALLVAGLAVLAIRKYGSTPELWALVANILAFLVFLNSSSYGNYGDLGRVTTGIVLMGLFSFPLFRGLGQRSQWAFYGTTGLWLSAWVVTAKFLTV